MKAIQLFVVFCICLSAYAAVNDHNNKGLEGLLKKVFQGAEQAVEKIRAEGHSETLLLETNKTNVRTSTSFTNSTVIKDSDVSDQGSSSDGSSDYSSDDSTSDASDGSATINSTITNTTNTTNSTSVVDIEIKTVNKTSVGPSGTATVSQSAVKLDKSINKTSGVSGSRTVYTEGPTLTNNSSTNSTAALGDQSEGTGSSDSSSSSDSSDQSDSDQSIVSNTTVVVANTTNTTDVTNSSSPSTEQPEPIAPAADEDVVSNTTIVVTNTTNSTVPANATNTTDVSSDSSDYSGQIDSSDSDSDQDTTSNITAVITNTTSVSDSSSDSSDQPYHSDSSDSDTSDTDQGIVSNTTVIVENATNITNSSVPVTVIVPTVDIRPESLVNTTDIPPSDKSDDKQDSAGDDAVTTNSTDLDSDSEPIVEIITIDIPDVDDEEGLTTTNSSSATTSDNSTLSTIDQSVMTDPNMNQTTAVNSTASTGNSSVIAINSTETATEKATEASDLSDTSDEDMLPTVLNPPSNSSQVQANSTALSDSTDFSDWESSAWSDSTNSSNYSDDSITNEEETGVASTNIQKELSLIKLLREAATSNKTEGAEQSMLDLKALLSLIKADVDELTPTVSNITTGSTASDVQSSQMNSTGEPSKTESFSAVEAQPQVIVITMPAFDDNVTVNTSSITSEPLSPLSELVVVDVPMYDAAFNTTEKKMISSDMSVLESNSTESTKDTTASDMLTTSEPLALPSDLIIIDTPLDSVQSNITEKTETTGDVSAPESTEIRPIEIKIIFNIPSIDLQNSTVTEQPKVMSAPTVQNASTPVEDSSSDSEDAKASEFEWSDDASSDSGEPVITNITVPVIPIANTTIETPTINATNTTNSTTVEQPEAQEEEEEEEEVEEVSSDEVTLEDGDVEMAPMIKIMLLNSTVDDGAASDDTDPIKSDSSKPAIDSTADIDQMIADLAKLIELKKKQQEEEEAAVMALIQNSTTPSSTEDDSDIEGVEDASTSDQEEPKFTVITFTDDSTPAVTEDEAANLTSLNITIVDDQSAIAPSVIEYTTPVGIDQIEPSLLNDTNITTTATTTTVTEPSTPMVDPQSVLSSIIAMQDPHNLDVDPALIQASLTIIHQLESLLRSKQITDDQDTSKLNTSSTTIQEGKDTTATSDTTIPCTTTNTTTTTDTTNIDTIQTDQIIQSSAKEDATSPVVEPSEPDTNIDVVATNADSSNATDTSITVQTIIDPIPIILQQLESSIIADTITSNLSSTSDINKPIKTIIIIEKMQEVNNSDTDEESQPEGVSASSTEDMKSVEDIPPSCSANTSKTDSVVASGELLNTVASISTSDVADPKAAIKTEQATVTLTDISADLNTSKSTAALSTSMNMSESTIRSSDATTSSDPIGSNASVILTPIETSNTTTTTTTSESSTEAMSTSSATVALDTDIVPSSNTSEVAATPSASTTALPIGPISVVIPIPIVVAKPPASARSTNTHKSVRKTREELLEERLEREAENEIREYEAEKDEKESSAHSAVGGHRRHRQHLSADEENHDDRASGVRSIRHRGPIHSHRRNTIEERRYSNGDVVEDRPVNHRHRGHTTSLEHKAIEEALGSNAEIVEEKPIQHSHRRPRRTTTRKVVEQIEEPNGDIVEKTMIHVDAPRRPQSARHLRRHVEGRRQHKVHDERAGNANGIENVVEPRSELSNDIADDYVVVDRSEAPRRRFRGGDERDNEVHHRRHANERSNDEEARREAIEENEIEAERVEERREAREQAEERREEEADREEEIERDEERRELRREEELQEMGRYNRELRREEQLREIERLQRAEDDMYVEKIDETPIVLELVPTSIIVS